MKYSKHWIFTAVAVASLAACGGGDSAPAATTPTPAATTPAVTTPAVTTPATTTPAVTAPAATTPAITAPAAGSLAPSPSAAATAEITNSQSTADTLKNEALNGYAAAKNASVGAGFQGPLGVESGALPSGVTGSISCSVYGGTGSVSYDFPSTAIGAGTEIVYSYNACSFSGYTYNGVFRLKYTRYTSATDFAFTSTYENFTLTGNGLTNQSFSGSQSYDYRNGVVSSYYSDGTRGWSSTMTYTNNTANGSYSVGYGSGTVTVKYTNFGATSGTAEITGANGSKVLITRTSATGFTLKLTDKNGTVTTYNYA
jgi:hypothetical protein